MSTFLRIRQLLSPLTSSCRRVPSPRAYATEVPIPSTSAQERTSTPFVRIVDGLYKTYKPITPSIRHLRRPLTPYLYPGRPLRHLTRPQRSQGGRNANGRITVRGRGGGHKRRIRTVDFMRTEGGVQDVVRIEYDPGRSGHIALLKSRDQLAKQTWSYILAPEGLLAGHTVQSFRSGIPDGLVPGYVDVGRNGKSRMTVPELAVSPGMKEDKAVCNFGSFAVYLLAYSDFIHSLWASQKTVLRWVNCERSRSSRETCCPYD